MAQHDAGVVRSFVDFGCRIGAAILLFSSFDSSFFFSLFDFVVVVVVVVAVAVGSVYSEPTTSNFP